MKKKIISIIISISMLISYVVVVHSENYVFNDVPQSHWAYDVVFELTSKGIIDGIGNGDFAPEGMVTREQFMKLLVCVLECDIDDAPEVEISDVSNDNWSERYIRAGIECGIYDVDKSGDYFNPTDELKRGISAEWIVNGLGITSDAESEFFDVPSYGSQSEAIAAAAKIGIVEGYEDNTFRAENTITRAEAAAMIKRVMDYQADLYALRDDAKNEIELQDDVEIAESSQSVNVPISVDTKNKTIIFSNADEILTDLEDGDILFIPPCDNMPDGFVGKIVSISGGRSTKIKFEEPELTEVVKSVDISTYVFAGLDDYADDGDVTAVSTVKGVSSKENGMKFEGGADANADIDISLDGVKVYAGANANEKATVHFETKNYNDKDGLYAAVDMSMEAKVDIQLETDDFDIRKFEASADLITDIAAVGGYSNSFSKEYTYELPTCSIPVSGLFNINIYSNLVVQADGSLNIEAAADFNNDMGAKFTIDDGFTTHNTTNASAGIIVDAEGSLKIGPKEELKLNFCGIEVMGKSFFDGISLLEAEASFGIGANGKTTINKKATFSDDGIYSDNEGERKHLCWFCIEGDIIRYFNGNVGVGKDVQELINKFCDKKLSYQFVDSEDKISNWHLSTGEDYTLEFELQKCPHYEFVEQTESSEAVLHNVMEQVVGYNFDYLYFLPDDYDGDGKLEAFGITGWGLGEEIYSNVNIWFIDSELNCVQVASGLYGVLRDTVTADNQKFIVWEKTSGGSGSVSYIYGYRNGLVYEPEISGCYEYFRCDNGKYYAEKDDFSKGYHDWITYGFIYDSSHKQFIIKPEKTIDYSTYIGKWDWENSIPLLNNKENSNTYDEAWVDIKNVNGNDVTLEFYHQKGGTHLYVYDVCHGTAQGNIITAYTDARKVQGDTVRENFKIILTLYDDMIYVQAYNLTKDSEAFSGDCYLELFGVNDWKDEYCNILNNTNYSEYTLYDIDKDNVPELILNDYQGSFDFQIYGIKNNRLINYGEHYTSYGMYEYSQNGILITGGGTGMVNYTILQLQGDVLTAKKPALFEASVIPGVQEKYFFEGQSISASEFSKNEKVILENSISNFHEKTDLELINNWTN